MPILTIYRPGRGNPVFAEVSTGEEETVFNGEVMAMNKITSNFTSPTSLIFNIGDYILHNSHIYKIFRDLPTHEKTATNEHTYSAVFLGIEYGLFDKALRHLGNAIFSFLGTAGEHLALIIGTANTPEEGWETGWSIGSVDLTEPLNVDYDKDSCRTAISKVAEAFGLEYEFKDKVLFMKKQIGGFVHDLTFSYGMDNGLYKMTKKPVEDSTWGTHFYGYGGTKNLPANYRGGLAELSFNPGYVQRNINKYGRIERHVEFPEIYPERTGTVTAASLLLISDTTLDFNLNDVIVQGNAKVIFISGDLRNQEFEIDKYDHASKTIKINFNEDENGNKLPNNTVKAKAGDQYKLVGMAMPQGYIDNAESRLVIALNKHADENQDPPLQYELGIEEIFMLQKNYQYVINQGDKVKAVETDMGVDVVLRVVGISYPIFRPSKITATIADKVSYTLAGQVLKDLNRHEDTIALISKSSKELARINSIRRRELQDAIFDPDGYFDAANIKPGSIETQMLVAGARSQDFTLDIVFKPNFNANPNVISWTGGSLTHLSIEDVNRTWSIVAGSKNDLVATTLYYIYAKCPKVGTSGAIAIEPAQRRVDADPDYYYFLIGVLHTVILGVRPISATYGFSELNGRFLTTGRVQSADGLTWFDLDLGEISGVIKFRSTGGGLVNVNVVDDRATNALTNAANADSKAVAAQSAAANAQSTATNAATAASNAQTSANTANSVLSDIANDNLLMPSEKQDVLKEWQIIQGERPVVVAQAGTYSISTTSYDTAYNNLNSYLTPLLTNMNANSSIDGAAFRNYFKSYYDSKVALLKLISDKSKQLADAAQATANTVGGDLSTAVGQLTSDATAKANAAQTAAQNFAAAQDSTLNANLQIYTDGKVSVEEQARQYQAQQNLNAAYADASAKAQAAKVAALTEAAVDAQNRVSVAINYADAKAYSSGKMLYRDPDFRDGTNGLNVYNNNGNGTVLIERLDRSAWGTNQFALPTNSPYGLRIRNTGAASPGAGGFYFGTQTRSNAKFVVRIVAHIPVGSSINWASNSIGDGGSHSWATSQSGTGKWEEYICVVKCGYTGSFSSTNFFYLQAPADGFEWYVASATVYDVTDSEIDYVKDASAKALAAQTEAINVAGSYAQGLANIAQSNAISAAATDAQNKANAAYNNALSAANNYAATVANSAASQAEINAAADALNKANTAYNNAVAAANSQYQSLTASLKGMAYQDLVELSKLGNTIIDGGKIKTVLLDAAAIQANVVTSGYINTLSLDASAIKTGLLSADRIDVNNLVAVKVAANTGYIAGWTISGNELTSTIDGGRIRSEVAGGSGGFTQAVFGQSIISNSGGASTTYSAGRFLSKTVRTGFGSINVGVYAEASGASTKNIGVHAVVSPSEGDAIYVDGNVNIVNGTLSLTNTNIFVDGEYGQTVNINAGGARMRFARGLYVGFW